MNRSDGITHCGISGVTEFHTLWDLPALPLTERFGPYDATKPLSYDQSLVISLPTGHVQLRHRIDPGILYTDSEYSFRTATSGKSRRGVKVFMDFFRRIAGEKHFDSLVDIGGNDLYVAREFQGLATHRAVVDPICSDQDGQVVDNIKVLGRFIEQVDLARDIPRPDIVVCRHTLEHVAEPRGFVQQCLREGREDCLYLFEVPAFDCLCESLRFDAIFHQHYHYFDLPALRWLVEECGGEYLGHHFNHQGSCGGALLLAFRKAAKPRRPAPLDVQARIAYIEERIRRYRSMMNLLGEELAALPRPIYGFGASLMLATLGYHLRTDFSMLECILDDDPAKEGTTYENVPVKVRHTAALMPPPDASYLVSSLENLHPILARLQSLSPRKVLVPVLI
jgi:cyclopropane-fatty-acyl-phospholipid synthase